MYVHFSTLFFFQAEDGIRDLVRSRGLGDVYKRQVLLVPGVAEAGTTNQPYANGNNATGYGYGFSSTDFHDIDRKVCGPVSYTHLTPPTSDLG